MGVLLAARRPAAFASVFVLLCDIYACVYIQVVYFTSAKHIYVYKVICICLIYIDLYIYMSYIYKSNILYIISYMSVVYIYIYIHTYLDIYIDMNISASLFLFLHL